MSSIRVESVRLCWLEAFVSVANAENISGAARELAISQPTVSRYIQFLERWTGRKLVEIGRIHDPEDARVNVGLTQDGREFFDIASSALSNLQNFRTEQARRDEKIHDIVKLVSKMRDDLESEVPTKTALKVSENIRELVRLAGTLNDQSSLKVLETLAVNYRRFFAQYEYEKARELRSAKLVKKDGIDASKIKIG